MRTRPSVPSPASSVCLFGDCLQRTFRSSISFGRRNSDDDNSPKALPDRIDRLPFEIQGNIFLQGQAMQCREDVILGHMPFEVLVSQVCRRWRTVALGTPRLWARISVRVHDTWFEMLNCYLDRSQDCDLDILVDFPGLGTNYPTSYQKDVAAFLARIVDYPGRWRRLEVWSPYAANLRTIFDGMRKRKAWQLKSMAFTLKHDDESNAPTQGENETDFALLPEHVPVLTHMHLLDMTGPVLAIVPTVTHLRLETAHSRHFFPNRLLSCLPLLFELCLCNYVAYATADAVEFETTLKDLGPISIPTLKRLRVEGLRNPITLGRLLMVLDTPNLEFLHLENVNEDVSERQCLGYQYALAETLITSSKQVGPKYPALTTLEFYCEGCTNWFENFIEVIPSIDHILVQPTTANTKGMVSVRMPTATDGSTHLYFPRLQKLDFPDMDLTAAFPHFLLAVRKERGDAPRVVGYNTDS